MKRLLLSIVVVASIVAISACSKSKRWSEKERHDVRREVRAYRDMAYLDKVRNRLPFWKSADQFTIENL